MMRRLRTAVAWPEGVLLGLLAVATSTVLCQRLVVLGTLWRLVVLGALLPAPNRLAKDEVLFVW